MAFDACGPLLVSLAFPIRCLQVTDSSGGSGTDGRGRAVVKMKPGAYERTASINALLPAIYPPTQPKALARVPSITSIRFDCRY
jgi:hypothetical protein